MFRQQYCFKSWKILRIYNHMLSLVSLKLGAQLSYWSIYRASHIVLDYLQTRCTISYWSRYRASHIVLDYLHTRCTISYWSIYRASHIVLDYLHTRCTISYWSIQSVPYRTRLSPSFNACTTRKASIFCMHTFLY